MSTFGTALVIDVAPGCDLKAIATALNAREAFPLVAETESGWMRVSAFLPDVGQLDLIERLVASAGTCRAAVAEDNDEYGALWVVLSAQDGSVRTVHRRYILNADPEDPADVATALRDLDGVDPRTEDVAGAAAAAAAAELFGVEAGPMLEAERESAAAHEEIGVVGGPFPWWDALELLWGGVGEPLR